MADEEATVEEERETDAAVEAETDREDEVVLDVEAVGDETALAQKVEEQAERIDELEDLVLDLSVRVADDQAMGVCPDCHGPVMKVGRWIRPSTIECRRCDRVFHTY
jgi:hypothetical protein